MIDKCGALFFSRISGNKLAFLFNKKRGLELNSFNRGKGLPVLRYHIGAHF